jgi:hypothetical protein
MQTNTDLKPSGTQLRPDTTNNTTPTQKSDPNWKPQPCGLSREELRKIVAEILG